MVGAQLGPYRVLRILGQGGMGTVYEAVDSRLDRTVAIKVPHEKVLADADLRSRFEREARAAASLNHPGICSIFDIGSIGDQPFLVLELVNGTPLDEWLKARLRTLTEVLSVAVAIAEALREAHSRGVVHRDLKPANILITSNDTPKIMDFGLARELPHPGSGDISELTTGGVILGTPGFMSPEQVRGEMSDERSDLFSFGVVLYFMLTGKLPFGEGSPAEMLAALLKDDPDLGLSLKPEIPVRLQMLVRRALQERLEDRIQTADEFLSELREVLADLKDVPETAPRPWGDRRTPVRTSKMVGRGLAWSGIQQFLRRASDRLPVEPLLLVGEAGIGKTRLITELLEDAEANGFECLMGHCDELEGTVPFYPFREILRELLRRTPASSQPTLVRGLEELSRLVPEWQVNDSGDSGALPRAGADHERWLLFTTFVRLLQRLADQHPVILGLEDIHWADSGSLALLHHLATNLPKGVFLIGTVRDDSADWTPSFKSTYESLVSRRLAKKLTLGALDLAAVGELLADLAGSEPPSRVRASFYKWSDGNPLFVEEVFHHLLDEGSLCDSSGNWLNELSGDVLGGGGTVGLVVEKRLRRLSPETRSILTIAAVVGRRFDLSLLEAVVDVSQDEVFDAMEEGERAGVIEVTASEFEVFYSFHHALLREGFLLGLSIPRRQRIHLRVAEGLERLNPTPDGESTVEIAAHLRSAGRLADASKTIDFLARAAQYLLQIWAYQEAIPLLRSALERLETLPVDKARDELELQLRLSLASPLSVVKGYGSEEVERLHERIHELRKKLNSSPPGLAPLMWRFSIIRGRLRLAREMAETMVREAESGSYGADPLARIDSHRALATTLLWQGEPGAAVQEFAKVLGYLAELPEARKAGGSDLMEDRTVFCLFHQAWTYWFLGFPDRAQRQMREAIAEARRIRHAFSETAAMLFQTYLHQLRGELEETACSAEGTIRLARDGGYPFWLAAAMVLKGWCEAQAGVPGGLELIQQGISAWKATGAGAAMTYYRLLNAQAEASAHRIESALASLVEAREECETRSERLFEPEIDRLRGELLLQAAGGRESADDETADEARARFRRALDTALKQESTMPALRAAVSGLQLASARGWEREEARASLRQLIDSFSEGLASTDLMEARKAVEL
jgi:tetratricopeptide (TPR) repeat protein